MKKPTESTHGYLGRTVPCRPWLILAVAVLTAGAAGVWTTQSLGYKVSRVDLLDPDSEYNKLWIDYIHEFGEEDDAVVVVEARIGQQR